MAPSTKSVNTRAQVAGSSLGEDGGDFRGDAGFSPQGGVSRKLKGGAAGIWSAAGFAWRGLALEPVTDCDRCVTHSSIMLLAYHHRQHYRFVAFEVSDWLR